MGRLAQACGSELREWVADSSMWFDFCQLTDFLSRISTLAAILRPGHTLLRMLNIPYQAFLCT
jgi:hypothetical protein